MNIFWEIFSDAPLVVRILGLLQLALTVWMLVDAYQRHADHIWYWVVVLFQPIGAWVYFFAVKYRTLRLSRIRPTGFREPKLSLDELRYRVERAPTVANRLAMAQGLMAKGAHADAIPYLEAVLAVEPSFCAALHALAECRLATGAAQQAVVLLERLIQHDHRWSSYRAWRTLIDVHQACGQPADALKACRELEKRLPTLENKCLLAEHLLDNGIASEAVPLMGQALEDYQFTPWGARWGNRRWAREARRLLAAAKEGCGAPKGAT